MDFHTLSRKELQALCKKNKIPANMTNVAMANALADLQQVEGLDEFMNSVDSEAQKFPDEKGVGTPDIHRTACRTSTRRKPSVREEPESCKVTTRRRTRAGNDEGIDQENKDLNVPVTPAVPSSRTRAPAVTTRGKKEDEKPTEHVHKTPAASRSRVRTTSAYNTRRSVRLLEKHLTNMNLTEETGSDDISEGMTSVSQQIEDSVDTEKGASSQTVSTEDLEKTNEVEVTSSEKNTGYEYECQSNDSKSAVQSDLEVASDAGASSKTVSAEDLEKINEMEVTSSEMQSDSEPVVENDAGDSLQADSQDCQEEINELEASSMDISSCYEGEPQDSNSKPSLSSEKCYDSDEVSEFCDESEVDLTKAIDREMDANNETGIKISCDSSEPDHKVSPRAESGVSSVDEQKEDEHSTMGNDYQNSELINKAAESDVPQAIDKEMDANNETDHKICLSAKNGESSVEDDAFVEDTEDKQKEDEHSTTGSDYQNSELMNKPAESDVPQEIDTEMDANIETGIEISCDSSEPDHNISSSAKNDVASVEDDASLEDIEDKQKEEEHSTMGNDCLNSELIGAENEAVKMDDSSDIHLTEGAVEDDASVVVVEDKHEENEYLNVANDIQNSELVGAENEAVKVDNLAEIYDTEGAVEDDASAVVVEDKHEENEYSNEANHIENSELIGAVIESVKVDDLAEIYDSEDSTGKQHEILEEKAYPPMVVREELKESKEFVEKDANSENSVADTQICIEPPMVVCEEAKAEAEPETTDFHTVKDIEPCKEQAVTEETLDAIHTADETFSTVTCAPICNEQQTSDEAVEVQTIRKMPTQEENDQKENLMNVDLHKKSMRELKKMLKNLSLDGKTNTKSSTNPVNKEVERKRTALQVLPENRMTASNGQNDS